MIEINNLTFKYDNDDVILNDISFKIEDGDFLLIHGQNGSGKSTLLKCLLNINKVDKKMIKIDGVDINSYSDFTKLGYVEQVSKVKQDVSITGLEYFKFITKNENKINQVIELLSINDIVAKDISNLSGGQLQKILIARALLHDIKYLFLDEPNTGLDFESRKNLYAILNKLNEKGITIIIISHLISEVSCKINKIYELSENKIIMEERDSCEYC